jgi:hypothetical protein
MPYFKPFPVADESALKRFGGRAQTVVRRCTRTLRSDPRDRQQHLLQRRTPAGLVWLHTRMDAWPADYIADRWVDLSQWLVADPALLPLADTIRRTNRPRGDTILCNK